MHKYQCLVCLLKFLFHPSVHSSVLYICILLDPLFSLIIFHSSNLIFLLNIGCFNFFSIRSGHFYSIIKILNLKKKKKKIV